NEYSTILRAGKLFQEFIVDAWTSTEQNRLTYFCLNQSDLHVDLYIGLDDGIVDGFNENEIGKRSILPSSFAGNARHMFEIFQDSMAITRYNQHPNIFLTMTVNPSWPEISGTLLAHQHSSNWPNIITHVFEMKR
ncbi:hypothetical protein G3V67_24155, partial [Escherichia coli]|nr:hypothetical protein [Escherichia coli]